MTDSAKNLCADVSLALRFLEHALRQTEEVQPAAAPALKRAWRHTVAALESIERVAYPESPKVPECPF